jgi:hypothetical protein
MRRIGILLVFIALLFGWSLPVWASIDPQQLGEAVTEIELLDQMRAGLASSLTGTTTEPTLDTFKTVCAPVGKQAQKIAQDHGWQVRQVALKYRNPQHKPQDLTEEKALAELIEHPDLQAFWQVDARGVNYFRRINVESSCLACHGAKATIPAFVKNKYPTDLAYDFQVGDLRGMYHVLIPNPPEPSTASAP